MVAERWTPLILRNLMFGANTFSTLKSGVPQMSRSMLVTRLRELERAGVVQSAPKGSGSGHYYTLKQAGWDLLEAIEKLGEWGDRRVELGPEHTDPRFALWAWCQMRLNRQALPAERVVIAFAFADQPVGNRHFWLLVENGDAQICYRDPGGEPAVYVQAGSRAFID
ncbi:MAG: helix-turn-helix domain-containing protein [Lapillicoccus sp.]